MSQILSTRRGRIMAAATRAPAPSRLAPRPTLRAGLVAAFALVALIWLSAPATAQECAITDLECINEQLEDTVDAVGGAAGDAADDVTDAAEEAAETAQGIVNDTTDKAKEIIDGLLGRGGKNPGVDKGKDKGRVVGGAAQPGGQAGIGPGLQGPRDPRLDTTAPFGAAGRGGSPTPEAGGGLGRSIANGVRDLAFPLLLVALVLGFLALQNRLDRRDPKLAAAPLGPDFLTFD